MGAGNGQLTSALPSRQAHGRGGKGKSKWLFTVSCCHGGLWAGASGQLLTAARADEYSKVSRAMVMLFLVQGFALETQTSGSLSCCYTCHFGIPVLVSSNSLPHLPGETEPSFASPGSCPGLGPDLGPGWGSWGGESWRWWLLKSYSLSCYSAQAMEG